MGRPPRAAIVTGAASGLGFAIARRLGADGFAVVLADRQAELLDQAVETLAGEGVVAHAHLVDVTDAAGVEAMVGEAVNRFGQLDVMISNAGIGGLYHFLDQPLEHWNQVLAVNLTGVFLCGQVAARAMAIQRSGRIVNIASVAGLQAGSGRTAYGTSKAAVIHLTKQMALELGAFGVSVNAVAPGPVETPMVTANHTDETRHAFVSRIPLERYGDPQEVAAA
ncbi:MAG: oxidoreductase, partial [Caulobacteraceae bacterium]|nr:oxidoreductase [Caulobacteraceae bacterium]